MNNNEPMVTIHATMTERNAIALAQFLKRSSFSDFRTNAVTEDEAYQMIYGADTVRNALAEEGFAPR